MNLEEKRKNEGSGKAERKQAGREGQSNPLEFILFFLNKINKWWR